MRNLKQFFTEPWKPEQNWIKKNNNFPCKNETKKFYSKEKIDKQLKPVIFKKAKK